MNKEITGIYGCVYPAPHDFFQSRHHGHYRRHIIGIVLAKNDYSSIAIIYAYY